MKRFALVVLLLTALAAGVFLALHRPGAQASPDVTITVNSVDDIVDPNAVLTLREAMKLATGELSLGDLAGGECVQVSGAYYVVGPGCKMQPPWPPRPGASSPDTIVFDPAVFPPASPATIALASALPDLSTGNDTVDGSSAGVIVDGVSKSFGCFDITSDSNTIKGLQIYNCSMCVRIHDAAGSNTTQVRSGC